MPLSEIKKEFSDLIREYAAYLGSAQGCSPKTIEEYLVDLRIFFRFLLARERDIPLDSPQFQEIDVSGVGLARLEEVSQEDIYEFLFYTNEQRDNHWSARARKLSAIRSLYRYLVNKRKYLKNNPTTDIDTPKAQKSLPKVLTLDEATALLDAVDRREKNRNRLRDFAILTLFLNCGMRVSELVGIDINDIASDMTSLRVTGKGSKERVIYLNDACQDALTEYLPERFSKRHEKAKTDALFLSNREQRISVQRVQETVYEYLKLAGLGLKGYSVHKLRHTAATLMYQSGQVDVRVLKEILGHEQLNTTQIYTHVSNNDMQKAMDHNPLARKKLSKK